MLRLWRLKSKPRLLRVCLLVLKDPLPDTIPAVLLQIPVFSHIPVLSNPKCPTPLT